MNSMEERKIYYDNFKHEYTLAPDPLFEDVHRYASVYPGLKEDHYSEFYIGASLDRPYEDINMCFTYTNEDVANDEVGTKRGFCLKIFSYYYLASITLPPKEYTKTLIALLEENHIAVATTNTNFSLVDEAIKDGGLDPEMVTNIRNEAWDCLKRIVLNAGDGGLSIKELSHLFGVGNYMNILVDESITGEKVFNTIKAYLDEKAKKDANNDIPSPFYKMQLVDRINYVVQTAHTLQENYSWSMAQSIIDDLQNLVIDINNDNI